MQNQNRDFTLLLAHFTVIYKGSRKLILKRVISWQAHFSNKCGKCTDRVDCESIISAFFTMSRRNHTPIYRPHEPENQSICSLKLKREWYHQPDSEVVQYQYNFFLANIIKTVFLLIMERLWFIAEVQELFSICDVQKGTLGNFMIHDKTSRIISEVCMCHCILTIASVQWRHQYSYRER